MKISPKHAQRLQDEAARLAARNNGPDVKLARAPFNDPDAPPSAWTRTGGESANDLDRLQVSEHDERGSAWVAQDIGDRDDGTDPDVSPSAARVGTPDRTPARVAALSLVTGVINLMPASGAVSATAPGATAGSTTPGQAITPAKPSGQDMGLRSITVWKNTGADVIYVGHAPQQCNTPLTPGVVAPVRLETGATLYARYGAGTDGTLSFIAEYA